MTSRNFWNYYRDEINDDMHENNGDNYRITSNKADILFKGKNNRKNTNQ